MQQILLLIVLIFLVNYSAADCAQDPHYCESNEELEEFWGIQSEELGPRRHDGDGGDYGDGDDSKPFQVNYHTNINVECISGDMPVEERIKGNTRVSQLSVDDEIRGIKGPDRTPAWCKVEAVFPVSHSENQTTYDGFTADHLVIDHTVHPYGKKGEVRMGPVYTLATDCEASVNAAGQAFTPISTTFCPHELSWSEYLTLIAAVRRVTNRSGNFWYNLNVYHDNDTAKFPRWIDQLPAICREILQCSQRGQCQEFENVMTEFVHDHLNEQYAEVVERVFPKMGGDVDKEQAGTITEVVRSKVSIHMVLFSAVGGVMALVLLIAVAVAIIVYRGRLMKKKAEKKVEPKKTGDVLA